MPNEPCPRCGRQLVEITLDAEERAMTLRSCSHCDLREWKALEGPLALDGVLDDLSRRG
jgi:hypothetical protein